MTNIQQLVDELASRLRRSVAVDSPRGRLIASSRHFGDEDSARVSIVLSRDLDRRVARYLNSFDIQTASAKVLIPANRELGLKPRCCYPLRHRGRLLGFIWLIDCDSADAVVAPYAERIAQLLAAEAESDDARSRQLAVLGRRLLSADGARDEVVSELREHGFGGERSHIRLIAVAQPIGQARDERFPAIRETSHAREWLRAGRGMIEVPLAAAQVLICSTAPGEPADERDSLPDRLAAGHRDRDVRIGVSETGELHEAGELLRQALASACAAHIFSELDVVARWAEIYPQRLILEMVIARHAAARPPRQLDALFDPANSALLDTVETYLDHGGDRTATAEALFIHRSTLYYRLSQVQTLTGFDPGDGASRLALHLAVKMHRAEPRRAERRPSSKTRKCGDRP